MIQVRGLRFTTKTEGPGRGWWGPPKGTHVTGREGLAGGRSPSHTVLMEAIRNDTIVISPGDDPRQGITESHRMVIEGNGEVIVKPGVEAEKGEDIQAEVAAYQLSEELGLGIVPATEKGSYEDRPASVQSWVYNADIGYEREGQPIDRASARKVLIFDYIINNDDRHGGNFLEDKKTGKVIAIDHAFAFKTWESGMRLLVGSDLGERYAKTYGGGFKTAEIKLTGLEKMKFTQTLNNDSFWNNLGLSSPKLAATQERLRKLIDEGYIEVG
ncbi:MAG: hypothetical protein H8D67_04390 [Deltaproteobacteria bacterium]|nr:hypothetical protein [Deltaproteobacteria bacterium]